MSKHSKELEFIKQLQIEIQGVKNLIESIGSRTDKCEDTASDPEDRTMVGKQLMRDTLKLTREHYEGIQQLLDHAKKTDLRLTGSNENLEDSTNSMIAK